MSRFATFLSVAVLTTGLGSLTIAMAQQCDYLRASSSVGPCRQPTGSEYNCLSQTSSSNCGGSGFSVQIKDDFPLSCIQTQNPTNCNMKLSDCSIRTVCEWRNNKCVVASLTGRWEQLSMRFDAPCAVATDDDPE